MFRQGSQVSEILFLLGASVLEAIDDIRENLTQFVEACAPLLRCEFLTQVCIPQRFEKPGELGVGPTHKTKEIYYLEDSDCG